MLPAVFGGKDTVAVHDVETSADLENVFLKLTMNLIKCIS